MDYYCIVHTESVACAQNLSMILAALGSSALDEMALRLLSKESRQLGTRKLGFGDVDSQKGRRNG